MANIIKNKFPFSEKQHSRVPHPVQRRSLAHIIKNKFPFSEKQHSRVPHPVQRRSLAHPATGRKIREGPEQVRRHKVQLRQQDMAGGVRSKQAQGK